MSLKHKNKKLVLSLIKDDLINWKLVDGLREMGVDASHYSLHLCETILKLMGFKNTIENDKIYDKYFDLCKSVKYICIVNTKERIDELALNIYNYLIESKVD